MMTPQNIREKTFEKAVFGGYDMGSVDDFLENVAAEYAALQKENAVLKGKMKVLVEKIEDYRTTEDAMRMALLSAQKMANQIVEEARQNCETTLAEAKAEAEKMLREARIKLAGEEKKLYEARRSSVQYIESMRMLSVKHLDFLEALGEEPDTDSDGGAVVTPAPKRKKAIPPAPAEVKSTPAQEREEPELDDTVRTIENLVTQLADETVPDMDMSAEKDGAAEDEIREPTRLYKFSLKQQQ